MGLKQILNCRLGIFPTTSSPRFCSLQSVSAGWTTSASYAQAPWPLAGTLRRLWIKASAPIAAGQEYVVEIVVNGAASALAVTLSEGDTEASDLVHEVAVVAGDLLALKVTPATTFGADYLQISVQFEGADSSTSGYLTHGGYVSASAQYAAIWFNDYASWSATLADRVAVSPLAGTITNLYISQETNAGWAAGSGKTLTIYKNGVAQDGSGGTPDTRVTILYTTRTGYSTFSLSVAQGDLLAVRHENVGASPRAGNMTFGCAFTGDAPSKYIVAHYEGSTLGNGNTNSFFGYRNNWTAGTSYSLLVGPDPITLSNFYVSLTAAPGAGGSGKAVGFTLYRDGTPTDLALTLLEAATTQSDNVHSVAVATGQTIYLTCTLTNSPTTTMDQRWAAAAWVDSEPTWVDSEPTWVPIANWVEQEIAGESFPGGAARVLGYLWTEAYGSPGPAVKARLYNLSDSASVGESAEIQSDEPAACDFSVTLASGTKRYRLEVTSDPAGVDIFFSGRGVGP